MKTTTNTKAPANAAAPLPFSWTIKDWPPGVFPFKPGPARHLVRVNERGLLAAGALTRPCGHRLVVLGAGYGLWLASQASRVRADYEVAANRPAHAEKRFGGRDRKG